MAELNDHAAGNNESQPKPGGPGNDFLENEPSEQDADKREEADIDTQELREVPFEGVHEHGIAAEHGEAGDNQNDATASQAPANQGIAPHLQERRQSKDQPWKSVHL